MSLSGIGLAGCGRMGASMLAAMIDAGFNARGFDVKKIDGAGIDPAEFAKDLRILFTVVRDITQTEDVLFGAQNLIVGAPDLQIIVLCSTLSPRYVKNLRARIPNRIGLVDAPMSGAAIAAKERRLSFMLGGEDDLLSKLQPLFSAMGTHYHHMGEFGAGMSAKVLNNMLAATNTVMTRLVLDWAKQQELDEGKLLALIHTSSGQNWFASNRDQIEFSQDGFDIENTIGILKKDVQSALDAAPQDADTRLPDLLVELVTDLKPT